MGFEQGINTDMRQKVGGDSIRVGVVQLTSNTDVDGKLKRAEGLVREAASQGADLVALPENFAFLGREQEKLPYAQEVVDGAFLEPMRALARECRVGILAGTIPERGPDPKRVYNTSVLLGRDGETLGIYKKIHLFDIDIPGQITFAESAAVEPGTEPVVVEFEGWKLGLTVCYDLRFPELYRKLVEQGAEILTVPAAFTLQTGKDHWEVLLRARAIENQCFVVAPGQFGQHSAGRASWGKSLLADPWGAVLGICPERESVAVATFERADLLRVRAQLPCLSHRRLDGHAG